MTLLRYFTFTLALFLICFVADVSAQTINSFDPESQILREQFSSNPFATLEVILAETSFIFNTLLLLLGGLVAMFMITGFSIIEASSIKEQYVSASFLKNMLLFSLTGIMFFLMGYNLLFGMDEGGVIGRFALWEPDNPATLDPKNFKFSYAIAADWFFQMMLATVTALIVSGALAIRVKIVPFLIFVVFLTGFLYPTIAGWQWGGGWLKKAGFFDFGGATIIHSTAGWCALVGTILIGPRAGRFEKNSKARAPRNIGFLTLGTMVLWIGWLGYAGGSQLSLSTAADAADIATVFANTHLAGCGGIISALLLQVIFFKEKGLPLVLSGGIGGLVSISAEPLLPSPGLAILIGIISGAVVIGFAEIFKRLKIDDVTGVLPVHLACGIWGTLAVTISNDEVYFRDQFIGVCAVGFACVISSFIVWGILKGAVGIKLQSEKDLEKYQ
jgi:Amt family ammonium transporter